MASLVFLLFLPLVSSSTTPCQFLVHRHKIESLWVKLTTEPFKPLLVLTVFWILDRFEEVAVTPGTATVLRRAGTAAFDAARILHLGVSLQHLLDLDNVIPIVAEIVGVAEFLDPRLDDLAQFRLVGTGHVHFTIGVFTVLLAPNVECPQVVSVPAHDGLDDVVER